MTDTWEIRSRFTVESPKKIRMTLTTTAELGDWEKLKGHLDEAAQHASPVAPLVYELRAQISKMIGKGSESFSFSMSKPGDVG